MRVIRPWATVRETTPDNASPRKHAEARNAVDVDEANLLVGVLRRDAENEPGDAVGAVHGTAGGGGLQVQPRICDDVLSVGVTAEDRIGDRDQPWPSSDEARGQLLTSCHLNSSVDADPDLRLVVASHTDQVSGDARADRDAPLSAASRASSCP